MIHQLLDVYAVHATDFPPPRLAENTLNECCFGTSGGVSMAKAFFLGGVMSKSLILVTLIDGICMGYRILQR